MKSIHKDGFFVEYGRIAKIIKVFVQNSAMKSLDVFLGPQVSVLHF
jgi:hypothetical protein